GSSADASIESTLHSSKGNGSSLPAGVREEMENSFGNDFSGVRIHDDTESRQMSKGLNAQAFTYGQDIFFDRGKFSPGSREGKSLLAHELTHVVQQRNVVQRQPAPAPAKPKLPALNYKSAKAQNTSFSSPDSLGWGTKLETVA